MDTTDTIGKASQSVVLFDGVCNLCNGAVRFIIERDKKAAFSFASLQSEQAKSLLSGSDIDYAALKSILLVEEHVIYSKSDAVLRIAARLSGLWPMISFFRFIPRFIRDAIYDWIARNRYRWFGKEETCLLPSPELRQRFLDATNN